MQTIKQSILSVAIGLALVAGISYAWQGATTNPPGDNAPAPINVGLDTQTFGSSSSAGSKTLNMGNGTGVLNLVGAFNVGGVSIFNNNVGIGTGVTADNLFEIKSSSSYVNKDTFVCNGSDTAVAYMTRPSTCGRTAGKCTQVTTGSHTWSTTNNTQETAPYKGGGDCKEDRTCLATAYVKCAKPPSSIIKVVEDEGLSITDGTQGEGKVLTSDKDGNADWNSLDNRIKLSSYALAGLSYKNLGYHTYCALSYVYDSSSEDSQKIGSRVYYTSDVNDLGKHYWVLDNTNGYNPTTYASCFDFE